MDIDSNHSLLYSLYNTIDIDELKYPMIMDTNIADNTNQDGYIQDNCRYIIRKSLIRKKKTIRYLNYQKLYAYFIIFTIEISIRT